MCGAKSGPGARLSNLLAMVIAPCSDAIAGSHWIESTEDLLSKFEEFDLLKNVDKDEVKKEGESQASEREGSESESQKRRKTERADYRETRRILKKVRAVEA